MRWRPAFKWDIKIFLKELKDIQCNLVGIHTESNYSEAIILSRCHCSPGQYLRKIIIPFGFCILPLILNDSEEFKDDFPIAFAEGMPCIVEEDPRRCIPPAQRRALFFIETLPLFYRRNGTLKSAFNF